MGGADDGAPSAGGLPRRSLRWLLLGLAVRELFAAWTGHPYDFEVWIRTGHAVAGGSNPYESFWPPVPGVSFAYLDSTLPSAAYPPFWPALLGGLYQLWTFAGGGDRFVLYFLLKQPPILGDVATAFLLYRVVRRGGGSEAAAHRALAFWSIFPYAIIVSAIWGQFDALVVAVLLVAVALESLPRRAIAEGVGVFAKWITGILLPLELFRGRGAGRLAAWLVVAIPLVLALGTFRLLNWTLAGIQATASSQGMGGGGGMNLAQFLMNPAIAAAVGHVPDLQWSLNYLWVPVIVVAGWVGARWARGAGASGALRATTFVFAAFFLVRWGLNEQYMLYLFALLLVDVALFHPGRRPLLAALIVVSLAFLLINNDLGLWFLAPIDPSAFPLAVHVDQGTTLGMVRADALLVAAVAVTATLAQLVVVLVRDEAAPRPWLAPWVRAAAPPPGGPRDG